MLDAELRALLSSRCDGYWELLATAAGRRESVERTMSGLSRDALAAHTNGAAASPTVVDRRVQALAAHDKSLLIRMCWSWKKPEEISMDLMDAEADFWATAWSSSLRFLKAAGQAPKLRDPLPRILSHERDILFGDHHRQLRSWPEFLAAIREATSYDELRKFDQASFPVSEPISKEHLVPWIRAFYQKPAHWA